MAAPIVQADFEVMDQVAQRLSKNAESVTAMQNTLKQTIEDLRSTWLGDAAVAFQKEMHADILPAVQRLINAFQTAQSTTLEIKKVLQEAEQEAANLFKGDPTGGSASTQSASSSAGGGASSAGGDTAAASASPSNVGVMAGGTSSASASGSGSGGGGGGGAASAQASGGGGGGGGAASAQPTGQQPKATSGGGGGGGTASAQPTGGNAAAGGNSSLGKLSEKYETGGRGPGTVSSGKGDLGGASYGSYQMTSQTAIKKDGKLVFVNGGRVAEFLRNPAGAQYAEEFKGLKPGSAEFTAKWKQIAARDPQGFQAAQHQFIENTHYLPQVNKLKAAGLDVNNYSPAMRDVVWSTSVQHGPGASVITNAIRGKDLSQMSESQIINAIYTERSKTLDNGRLAYFKNTSDAGVIQGLKNRFVNERKDALNMIPNH